MNLWSALVGALRERTLLRRMLRPLVAFGALVGVGVAGFRALAGVGTVDAVFWLLDPTSIELHFREHEGPATVVKGFAVVVLSGVVLAGIWAGETLLSAVFGGRIGEEVTRMRTRQEIDELTGHVVVCGYGTFGRALAEQLETEGTRVVVVERADAQYEAATDRGLLAVQGDARVEETLLDAGVERATAVVGAVDDTSTNVKVAVTTSELSPGIRLVVRAGDQMDEAVARRVGADEVVVPEVLSARQLSTEL